MVTNLLQTYFILSAGRYALFSSIVIKIIVKQLFTYLILLLIFFCHEQYGVRFYILLYEFLIKFEDLNALESLPTQFLHL